MIRILDSLPLNDIISNEPICKCGCNCGTYGPDAHSVYERGTFGDGEDVD